MFNFSFKIFWLSSTFNYELCIMNYELNYGVPAKPSGFPLYLCSPYFRLATKIIGPNIVTVPETHSRFTRKGCRSNP